MTLARLEELFERIVKLPFAGRERLLGSLQQADPELADDLRALIRADEEGNSPTIGKAARLELSGDTANRTGQTVDHYELTQLLGEGGMGQVYLGQRTDGKVEQSVAVKISNHPFSDTHRMRFQLERRILASLNHEFIAKFMNAGELNDGSPFFVLEHIEGVSLLEYCRDRSVNDRIDVFLKLCQGIQHAHSRLVVHRDIKASNVLVTAAGIPKILDFGIAKPLDSMEITNKTSTAERFFSPSNAAPEQLLGGSIGVAVDIYGLGTLLYELLTEQPVFDHGGKTPVEVEHAILKENPIRPSDRLQADGNPLAKAVRGDLDAIVMTCLRKSADKRYLSVEQLEADLQCYLEDRPVSARRRDFWYRSGKFVRRNAGMLSISAVLAVTVATSATLLWTSNRQLQAESRQSEHALQFLASAFGAADPTNHLGAEVTARQILDQAARSAEIELVDDPDIATEVLLTIAKTNMNLGDVLKARNALDSINQLAGKAAIENDTQLAIWELQAIIMDADGNYDDFDELLAKVRSQTDEPSQLESFAYYDALRLYRSSQYDVSNDTLNDLLARGPIRDVDIELKVQRLMARNLQALGEYDQSLLKYQSTYERGKRAHPDNHPAVLSALNELIRAHVLVGQLDEASRLSEVATAATHKLYGTDSLYMARLLTSRGGIFSQSGDFESAMQSYQEALKLYRLHYEPTHRQIAMMSFNIALTAWEDEALSEQAEPYFRDAIDIGRQIWPSDHSNFHLFPIAFGLYLNTEHKPAEALQQFNAAFAVAEARPKYKEYDTHLVAQLGAAVSAVLTGDQTLDKEQLMSLNARIKEVGQPMTVNAAEQQLRLLGLVP